MNSVDLLIEAKAGSTQAFNLLVSQYRDFIFFEMNKYKIVDKTSCYDEIISNLLKVVVYFDPFAHN